MDELPKDVRRARKALSRGMYRKWTNIADKLVADTPELVRMWRTLEGLKDPDEPPVIWVWNFLHASFDASNLPPYHYKSKADRIELADTIEKLATRLARALEVNGLDAHLIHNNGKIFNGFFLYEDFGDSNRASIDADGVNKLKVSALIKGIAERAKQKISDEPMPGKSGANVKAIRFIRKIAAQNKRSYRKVLNAVTATAANAIFGTHYAEGDITNLLAR